MSNGSAPSGDPNLVAHERTYKVFNIILRWSMVVLGSMILGLSLAFATPAGLLAGLFVGVVTFVVGYLVLVRHEEHQPLDPWTEGR
jgi:thiamine transporter ThiT